MLYQLAQTSQQQVVRVAQNAPRYYVWTRWVVWFVSRDPITTTFGYTVSSSNNRLLLDAIKRESRRRQKRRRLGGEGGDRAVYVTTDVTVCWDSVRAKTGSNPLKKNKIYTSRGPKTSAREQERDPPLIRLVTNSAAVCIARRNI